MTIAVDMGRKAAKTNKQTFISIIRLKTENFLRPKIHKTRILPKVGNMTLLPNPGKPGFYGASNIVPTLPTLLLLE